MSLGIPIIDGILHIADKLIPDPQAKMQFKLDLQKLADQENARAHDEMMGQIGTNTEEAKNGNLFVAGWRPFIGWTGGVALAYSFILQPFSSWTAQVIFHYAGAFPALDTGQLMDLVMGMLGFGSLRTYEKVKGISDSQPTSGTTSNPNVVQPVQKQGLGSKVFGSAWPF